MPKNQPILSSETSEQIKRKASEIIEKGKQLVTTPSPNAPPPVVYDKNGIPINEKPADATKIKEPLKEVGYQLTKKSQRGKNGGRLEPEELQKLEDKKKEGNLNSQEKEKLKRHYKNTNERPSRQSKDKKKK